MIHLCGLFGRAENRQEDGRWLLWDRPRQGWYGAILDILDVSLLEKLKIAPEDLAHTGLLLGVLVGCWHCGVTHSKAGWASAHLGHAMLLKWVFPSTSLCEIIKCVPSLPTDNVALN